MHNLSLMAAVVPAATERKTLGSALDLPRLDPRTTPLPEPRVLVRWRQEADLRLESALAHFDDDLVHGKASLPAARSCVEEVMCWVRESVGRFQTDGGSALVGRQLRRREAARWDNMADRAVADADADPDGVERFLRLFLGMSHEVSARGFASLVATTRG